MQRKFITLMPIFCSTFLFLWLTHTAQAVEPTTTAYFISETGTDTTGGTFGDCALFNPCATISFVMNLVEDGDGITLLAGTYVETAVIDKSVTIGGLLTCDPACSTWRAPSGGPAMTVADGVTVELVSLNLQGSGSPQEMGGIIEAGAGNVIIRDSEIASGRAQQGGAIYQVGGTLTVISSTFVNNEALSTSSLDGGGAVKLINGGLTLSNTTAFLNNATDGGAFQLVDAWAEIDNLAAFSNVGTGAGGVIMAYGTGNPEETQIEVNVRDSRLNANDAGRGGAISAENLTLYNTVIFQNEATGSCGAVAATYRLAIGDSAIYDNGAALNGGGICFTGSFLHDWQFEVVNSRIRNNAAGRDGGGIYFTPISNSTLHNHIIAHSSLALNSAQSGGGLFMNSHSKMSIFNSTFSNNHADGSIGGGAIRLNNNQGAIDLSNVTIAENTTTASGGGVLVENGTLITRNSLLANNTSGTTRAIVPDDCTGTISSESYNLIGVVDDNCSLMGITGDDQTGTPATPLDPKISALTFFGNTDIHLLEIDSPAVNGGNPVGCTYPNGAILPVDQLFASRGTGGRCDIGAFELQSLPTAVSIRGQLSTVDNQFGLFTVVGLLLVTAVAHRFRGWDGVRRRSSINPSNR